MAQLQPPSHDRHLYEEDPHDVGVHSVAEGEGEHNRHKSVLKKVKDKAKKIKHTITKHGQEHEERHDQISEDEDDREDEEMENDPEVHGAPMYESTVIRGTNLPKQTDVDLPKPTDTPENKSFPNVNTPTVGDAVNRPSGPAVEGDLGRPAAELRQPATWKPLEAVPSSTQPEETNMNVPRVGPLGGLHEDPNSPYNSPQGITPSNYQAKVVDPTGRSEEVDVEPLVRHLDKMEVRDKSTANPSPKSEQYTGSHDQFAPQGNPPQDMFKQESNPGRGSAESALKKLTPDEPDAMPVDTSAGKLSSAANIIANKAAAAKNLVASKLGYGDQGHESLGPSKLPATGDVHKEVVIEGTDKGVSVKEFLVEKLSPGEEDKALSEAISEAFNKKMGEMQGTKDVPKTGRVFESEEVAARLGTGRENRREGEDAITAGAESSGAGVMDRLKDAVGSWLGKSTATETAKESIAQSYVSDIGSTAGAGDKGRLQESGK
ncbi:low-temperature-induced 65 kDa protein-like isoform X2 [Andrographis paniculata]|uniref:low-temperature-induced 65 kDa protein-like isoform X2 n=1 Tax=Andrographis paniculata TaxID=175694 RepID=UPI0021E9AB97|nr:low-temperature-induced 65 kDa protein-like isoform X2 [Andrographis paniculata]